MSAPRSTRGAFRRRLEGADRGRWLRKGATRTPAPRQPKPSGPGALIRAPLGTKGVGASAGPDRGFAGMSPQRWIGSAASQGQEPERSVHRGSPGIRLQTPRAGRWRNGGLAAITKPSGACSRSIAPPGLRERLRPAGPHTTPASRAALTFRGASRWHDSDVKTRRGKERVCLQMRDERACRIRAFPSPACGRGDRSVWHR